MLFETKRQPPTLYWQYGSMKCFMVYFRIYGAILVSCVFLISCCKQKSARDYLQEAKTWEARGNYTTANVLLDKAIEKDPSFLVGYINRGVNKSELGLFQEAILDYIAVLNIDSTNILAINNIANNYFKLGNFLESIKYYTTALKHRGTSIGLTMFNEPNTKEDFNVPAADIYYGRGLAYMYADSLKPSFNDFQHSIALGGNIPGSYYWMGFIYLKNGNKNKGCDYLYKAKSFGYAEASETIAKYCK